ncbi:glycoside hydrolase family 15 protein [Nonomuraea gerenzanensis]|uniref:Glucoamylase n=1 Tax=Nonomuraea gerenzanensis TaxID=93944 RepID=A0A1M4EI20_9ACTN|nr:glycoside hydrolase family 15 protein [Nonomuraea gerenzanensis]UBU09961.1 glycoside hydrolase family 15 protein [Nonomuraea gerenzanensis]SBO98414.1 Glucoamylase [Nonomuraea gerenzanensis]
MRLSGYPPIGSYAFLSDCHTAALVAADGAVEWMCVPRFDGPSVFARILDRGRGGAWELHVEEASVAERGYLDETLVLRTRWEGAQGSVVVHDFLALSPAGDSAGSPGGMRPVHLLVRWARCERGRAVVRSRVLARPGYGVREARWTARGEVLAEEESGLVLHGTPEPESRTVLREGESLALTLGYTGAVPDGHPGRLLEDTVRSWRSWSARCGYAGIGAKEVRHSAIVLRGLLYDEGGGLLAAPTTSLPEWPGGPRNWDYRYVWHRDAALTVLALLRLGHREEAAGYLECLLRQCGGDTERIPPMAAVDGMPVTGESVLGHLAGYACSRPVRIGNDASSQHQLDTYGHILDAALAYHEVTGELNGHDTSRLWRLVRLARKQWREPDAGIWEVRGAPRAWTYSKLYAWVCFDRAVRLAELTGEEGLPLEEWRAEREAVREDLLRHGYSAEAGAFTQTYGSTGADASLLRVPLVGFLDGRDPRVLGTLDHVQSRLGEGGALLHRYDPESTGDGVDGPEGAFLLCSFEMVSALVLAGRTAEARDRFETLCARAEPLGLFAEEMAPDDGSMLGNYPQAFTHLALIEAALNLDASGTTDELHDWASRGG